MTPLIIYTISQTLALVITIVTIDYDPDELHLDITPSVIRLIEYGEPVVPHILPLMLAEDHLTRLRLWTVLMEVTAKRFGFDTIKGWPSKDAESRWEKYWSDLGSFSYKAPYESRKQSLVAWQKRYGRGFMSVLNYPQDNSADLLKLDGHSGGVYRVAFSPDGKILASIADDPGGKVGYWVCAWSWHPDLAYCVLLEANYDTKANYHVRVWITFISYVDSILLHYWFCFVSLGWYNWV